MQIPRAWATWGTVRISGYSLNISAYGKNLTKLEQDSDISEIYTDLLPYAVSTDEEGVESVVTLYEHTLPITKILFTMQMTLQNPLLFQLQQIAALVELYRFGR